MVAPANGEEPRGKTHSPYTDFSIPGTGLRTPSGMPRETSQRSWASTGKDSRWSLVSEDDDTSTISSWYWPVIHANRAAATLVTVPLLGRSSCCLSSSTYDWTEVSGRESQPGPGFEVM